MDAPRTAAALVLALWLAAAGCALWQKPGDSQPVELPQRPISENTVMVEIARISLSSADEEATSDIWQEIDEQTLPLAKRRELYENGIRVGIIDYHIPEALREIMSRGNKSRGPNAEEMVRVDDEGTVAINQRRFPKGKRSEYVMVPLRDQLSLLESTDGVLRGKTYHDAECKLILMAFPQNDGRVRIDVAPEIHHGQARQHYAGGEGMLRIETRKERRVLTQVEFSAMLDSGQTLIVSATPDIKGLGQAFFQREHAGMQRRQILLIRLAGTQFDDLFRASASSEQDFSLSGNSTEDEFPSVLSDLNGD